MVFPRWEPAARYFQEHWESSRSWHLYYDRTLTDYIVHNLSEWCRQTGIEGYYSDNAHPAICDNIEAGRGYRLGDGRVQPVFNMFGVRRYFLRVRAAFAEQGAAGKIVIHTTHNLVAPWLGAHDIAYDGEHNVITPEMDRDFMDLWSLERLRAIYGPQWGVAFNFMHEYQGRWEPRRLAKAYRAYQGMVILHDALPSGNAGPPGQPLWIARDRFGIEADDVTFLPYWDRASGLACPAEGVHLAGWLRPGRLLLAVVNTGEAAEAVVRLDAAKLGLGEPGGWTVADAEAGCKVAEWVGEGKDRRREVVWDADARPAIRHDGRGTLTVPVERHDFRQVVIAAPGR